MFPHLGVRQHTRIHSLWLMKAHSYKHVVNCVLDVLDALFLSRLNVKKKKTECVWISSTVVNKTKNQICELQSALCVDLVMLFITHWISTINTIEKENKNDNDNSFERFLSINFYCSGLSLTYVFVVLLDWRIDLKKTQSNNGVECAPIITKRMQCFTKNCIETYRTEWNHTSACIPVWNKAEIVIMEWVFERCEYVYVYEA